MYQDIEIGPDGIPRCGWVGVDPLYMDYHDNEWAYPLEGDDQMFERLSLETFQAGLSWITILRKRENFRLAFRRFSITEVARFTSDNVTELLGNEGIIRNRAKIEATISNAQLAQCLIENNPGYFSEYLWSFRPEPNKARYQSLSEVPAATEESERMSAELKRKGFRFVGPTTLYALMQATGMVNDHLAGCHKAD